MRFDLTDLQLFVHILDCGTLTAAAGRAHMTLASASERVRGMEAQLGCALLARQARGVRPTAAGHTLGQHARSVLAQMQRLRGDMAASGAGLAGHVRGCGNTSAVGEHLPLAVAGFLRSHPRVALELQECGSAEVLDRLRQGLCDIGVASDAQDTRGLQALPWRPDPLVAVLPRAHRLARRKRLALQDLLTEDWVGLPHDAALQVLVRQQASLLGSPLRWRAQLQHLDSLCQLVGQGVGVAVMPAAAAQRLAPASGARAVPLSDAWARRQLLLCTAREDQLPAHARQLFAHLEGLGRAEP
ncbi:MAG: LysR family transcriptional regulator [Delftia acidovorans]|jgi:DNA-binding transcriptional LysR family regulator|nr:LysR family transcriptional regulator [Delftia acidovorans]